MLETDTDQIHKQTSNIIQKQKLQIIYTDKDKLQTPLQTDEEK